MTTHPTDQRKAELLPMYIIKQGRFGAYFYDVQSKRDIDLHEAVSIMNKAALTAPVPVEGEVHMPSWKKGYEDAKNTIMRRNQSGCCCKWNEDETAIVSMCNAHRDILAATKPAVPSEVFKLLGMIEYVCHAEAKECAKKALSILTKEGADGLQQP